MLTVSRGMIGYVHQLVGLLLLLQDSRSSIILVLALGARGIPEFGQSSVDRQLYL